MNIGKNADGDYIINGRLYTQKSDGNYHLVPISMDEAKTNTLPTVYTSDEVALMEEGFEFSQDVDLTNVRSSLILDSQVIATLEKDNIRIDLEVTGEKNITDLRTEETYRYAKDMSEDFKARLNQPSSEYFEEDINVESNNWFEVLIYDNGEYIDGVEEVVDVEENSKSDIISLLKNTYEDYVKNREQEEEKNEPERD